MTSWFILLAALAGKIYIFAILPNLFSNIIKYLTAGVKK